MILNFYNSLKPQIIQISKKNGIVMVHLGGELELKTIFYRRYMNVLLVLLLHMDP